MKTSFLSIVMLMTSTTAAAAEDSPPGIWRTISAGDAPEVVVAKLQAMPEVKSAKVKSDGTVKVNYQSSTGIEILGEGFRIVPEFEAGHLIRLSMGAIPSCMLKIEDRYGKFVTALELKYAEKVTPRLETSDFATATMRATEQHPAILTTVRANDQNAVMLMLSITKKDPPPSGITDSRLINALGTMLWNNYNATAAECDGTGIARVQFLLSYMTRAQLERQVAELKAGANKEITDAAKRL